MKKFYRVVLTLICLLSFAASALAADKAALEKLVILHTNDTHGYDLRDDKTGVGGMAAVAALKQRCEQLGYNVLLLDAGDAIQDNNLVNMSNGATAVQFMNAVGYDAATFGNHEFDYGQDELKKRIAEAKYQYLCANVIVEATGELFAPAPAAIFDKGGVKIGVIGLTTPSTKVSTHPKNARGLKFLELDELYACAEQSAQKLKAQGADIVIALTHLGSEEGNRGNNSEDILLNCPTVDMIIDGHDHRTKLNRVRGAIQAEAGCYTQNIGVIRYVNDDWFATLVPHAALYPNNDDKKVAALVGATQKAIDKKMAKKIATAKVTLDATRFPGVRTQEMNSGDFVADAVLWQARQLYKKNPIVGAIVNGGSIRASIPAGVVREGAFHKAMPYRGGICVIPISGAKLWEILEATTAFVPDAMGAFPQIAGIGFTLDTSRPYVKGERYPRSDYYAPAQIGNRVKEVTVGGQPVELDKIYHIATFSFVACGGDAYGGLIVPDDVTTIAPLECPGAEYLGVLDVDAMINYARSELGGVIGEEYAAPQGRIIIK